MLTWKWRKEDCRNCGTCCMIAYKCENREINSNHVNWCKLRNGDMTTLEFRMLTQEIDPFQRKQAFVTEDFRTWEMVKLQNGDKSWDAHKHGMHGFFKFSPFHNSQVFHTAWGKFSIQILYDLQFLFQFPMSVNAVCSLNNQNKKPTNNSIQTTVHFMKISYSHLRGKSSP